MLEGFTVTGPTPNTGTLNCVVGVACSINIGTYLLTEICSDVTWIFLLVDTLGATITIPLTESHTPLTGPTTDLTLSMTATVADIGIWTVMIDSLINNAFTFMYNLFTLTVIVTADPCSTVTYAANSVTTTYNYYVGDSELDISYNVFAWTPSTCTVTPITFTFNIDSQAYPGYSPNYLTVDTTNK
jgi:hypothetical protein